MQNEIKWHVLQDRQHDVGKFYCQARISIKYGVAKINFIFEKVIRGCSGENLNRKELIGMEGTPTGTARAENPLVSRYIEKQVSWSRARGTRPDRNGNQLPLFRKGFLCLVL